MGGAQPLAATMNGAAFLGVDVDPSRVRRRVESGYCDVMTDNLDEALRRVEGAKRERQPLSVGLVGNIADVLPGTGTPRRRASTCSPIRRPLTICASATFRAATTVETAAEFRENDAGRLRVAPCSDSMQSHVAAMLDYQKRGAVFDYGNNLRGQVADRRGMKEAFQIPGFVPEYIRPLFCRGAGPFRWAALSGDPADIAATDDAVLETFPHNESLRRWITLAREKVQFQGLPARICWLEYGERAEMGERFNRLVKSGKVKAPIVIGRDHLDCGSVASPNRETEGMKDGSDAIADWPLSNALLEHRLRRELGVDPSRRRRRHRLLDPRRHGDRGRRHRERRRRLQRVLTADPGLGVMRHADAGYDDAIQTARDRGVDVPMIRGA